MLLNIGLDSNTLGPIRASTAIAELERYRPMRRAAIVESDTETTLVVDVEGGLDDATSAIVRLVSDALGQDCIAVWDGERGDLIGRNAANWGAFSPEYFFDLDGRRLSATIAATA